MNPSESESSPPRAAGLQLELGAKTARRFRAAWLVSLLALIVVGSLTLRAWLPHTSAPPMLLLSPTPHLQSSSTSTQPKITWSPASASIEVILSPGESTAKDFTFTSSRTLSNVVIEPVPAIAPFLTITPSTFSSIPANTPRSVHVAFAIPTGTILGTYDGTIHLRIGTQTIPQTLKTTVNIWNTISDLGTGISLKYPAGLSASNRLSDGVPELFLYDTTSPDSVAVISAQSFSVPAGVATFQQVATYRLDDSIVSMTPLLGGWLFECDSVPSFHYIEWNQAVGKAVDIYGPNKGFFTSHDFQALVSTLRY